MTPNAVSDGRIASVSALARLLQDVVDAPGSNAAEEIKQSLKSQGDLAGYSNKTRGIEACSLNTLKRASVAISGGFNALDALRLRAQLALATLEGDEKRNARDGSKRQLQHRVELLSGSLSAAREDLMLLTSMLEKSMRQARLYARDSKQPALVERCRREQSELRDMMTLGQAVGTGLRLVGKEEG